MYSGREPKPKLPMLFKRKELYKLVGITRANDRAWVHAFGPDRDEPITYRLVLYYALLKSVTYYVKIAHLKRKDWEEVLVKLYELPIDELKASSLVYDRRTEKLEFQSPNNEHDEITHHRIRTYVGETISEILDPMTAPIVQH